MTQWFYFIFTFKIQSNHVTPVASHLSQSKSLQCLQAPAGMAPRLCPHRASHCCSPCFLLPYSVPLRWSPGPSSNQASKLPPEGFHSSCVLGLESYFSRDPPGSSPDFPITTFSPACGLLPCLGPISPLTCSTCLMLQLYHLPTKQVIY